MDKKYYIDTEGLDDIATTEAIKFSKRLSERDSNIERIVFLVHTKKHTERFDRYFGRETTKELISGIQIEGYEPLFKIETLRTYQYYSHGNSYDIVICFGMYDSELFIIDENESAKYMILIPWVKDLSNKWIKSWNAYNLRSNKTQTAVVNEPSCVIKEALKELTHSINLSTGITHPMDEELAKTYIRALHKYESYINPSEVYGYLIRVLNWQPKYAQSLENLIITLNDGRYFKGGSKTGLKNYYNDWFEKCKK